ncbi:hypothetical protein ACVR0O_09010 [Streptococcus caviae]|uniref:hypothetical protein n=1 Tax=Streptococcus sp. 'caviae' TaxID=1915004 RepID=UPI00094B9DBD|nr:hypothetical protein [Streptococcus sp. 'caviae']OLN82573.1 hypothetical protein BMI76_08895 [Streptococcus sp. 'caviae']
MYGLLALFLLFIVAFGALIVVAYPKDEGGNETLFGRKPIYLLQKLLELIILPVVLGLVLILLS